jgi:hypothetical protein
MAIFAGHVGIWKKQEIVIGTADTEDIADKLWLLARVVR